MLHNYTPARQLQHLYERAAQGDILAQTNLASINDTFHTRRTRPHPIAMLRQQTSKDLQERRAVIISQRGYKWEVMNIDRILKARELAAVEAFKAEVEPLADRAAQKYSQKSVAVVEDWQTTTPHADSLQGTHNGYEYLFSYSPRHGIGELYALWDGVTKHFVGVTWEDWNKLKAKVLETVNGNPIAQREQAAKAERKARPRSEWVEELDLEAAA